jgi:hypothetical protein
MTENGNKPAYPKIKTFKNFQQGETTVDSSNGMTKREAFALAAMQGMLSSGTDMNSGDLIYKSVQMADELLKALES